MRDTELKGAALFRRLESLKPDGVSLAEWAVSAGLSRTYIYDLKKQTRGSDSDKLRRLLEAAGLTFNDLEPRPPVQSRPGMPSVAEIAELPRDVPILGTAKGATVRLHTDGHTADIETGIIERDPIGFARRPPSISHNRKVVALLTEGDSMWPRYAHGDPIYADTRREPAIGEDAVVQLVENNGEGTDPDVTTVLIKELTKRTATHVELTQFNPALTFRIERNRIGAIWRVIPWRELLW